MQKVQITNESKNLAWSAEFPTLEAAQAWLDAQVGKPNRLPERVIRSESATAEQIASALEVYPAGTYQQDGIVFEEEMVRLPAEFTSTITDISQQHQQQQLEILVQHAIRFGNQLLAEFAAENIAMEITQEGLTKQVRQRTSEVVAALQTGSLYDAIDEIKAIPESDKDSKYITDARLLQFINKIENYLQIPNSTSL